MSGKSFISYKTLTYGRVHMLEEAIYSFLQQHDSNSEMVIINDYPLQELIFDHPKVKIINLKETFLTLGEKENFATEQCQGDIIVQADDDDIALPNHNDNIRTYFKFDTDIMLWTNAVYYNEPQITAITQVGNSGMVYSKRAWEQVGRYPIENAGHDMSFRKKLTSDPYSEIVHAHPPNDKVSWFYRWATVNKPQEGLPGVYHASGQGTDTPDRLSAVQRHAAYIEGLRVKGYIPIGKIKLKPHWNKDYSQMLKDFINGK